MNTRSTEAKLAQLRAKTDRDLVALIQRELAFGIALMNANDVAATDRAKAEQVYANTMKLMAKLEDPAAVTSLERKSKQLRNALDSRLVQAGHA